MIRNYIFDFGNVLAEYNPEKLTAAFVQDEEQKSCICEVVFDRVYWNKLDDGTITDVEVKDGIRSRLPEEYRDVACKVYDNWVDTLTPIENMRQLIYDLHKSGKKIYLLSNISKGFASCYGKVKWIKELLDEFDGLVLSGTIGKVKPNRDIYEHLLETYKLNASECLFIDDMKINIEGALAVGIKGYLFDGDATKLREYLNI